MWRLLNNFEECHQLDGKISYSNVDCAEECLEIMWTNINSSLQIEFREIS